jgi:cyclophilin family peptidyl-prolyl cis-trans isomerase
MRWFIFFLLLSIGTRADDSTVPSPTPIPTASREEFQLAPFYVKHVLVGGLPIVASAKCSDAAVREAAWIVQHMLAGRDDLLAAMSKARVRLAVMAASEYTTDIPEHSKLQPRVYWDRRARGLGATPDNPCVSCAEENLLSLEGDPYREENILVHEFAHAIHETGLLAVDRNFDPRLKQAYDSAIAAGRWKGTYAAVNHQEYWAEGVQSWFDDNRENDALHNYVNTRAELREYDPALAALCKEVFGDGEWRYVRPAKRAAADRAHLAGFAPSTAPRFSWRPEPIPEKPVIAIHTELGEITIELDHHAAPRTVENFLTYAHQGLFNGGRFHRTVTPENQPNDAVKIAVIQAEADPKQAAQFPSPIALERTRDTGLRHLDGTISMARDGPDTGRDSFFICIGDQAALDFGGARQSDGQGFAAFGRVTKGMEIVRKIHAAPADGQTLKPPLRIQRVIRMN